mmetsp:Transcript_2414/g.6120  ORF Transcript_2414/g.6120 Transcript_2414/m.6120 type:complete len:86 (+) Transcript_2414:19-276(+)|eukprot:CAMPEP_0202865822 /NCGR_PEP_ID=MMETSP1391-20130828/6449_1 /ASSEMBLY_ACC=CAM_ASM_000867 /TAXON_ID=1034604 /ORGANISM="Chlamydomonas leiostraca, Strain SAG 11-49" /LENGTH=85 /DNA_ID=CAMNT_0049545701 /DNA_START=19 /DNA_END=276 /DNA_ORIENTATION=+
MANVSDEELARKLQAEIDAGYAALQHGNATIAAADAELAKRLQEEADLEAQFDAANAAMEARLQAEAATKPPAGAPAAHLKATKA